MKIKLSEEDFKIKNTSKNYLTHNFHSYPARFITQIPKKTIEFFTKENETILDPFCGCGTTLVEAKLYNRNAIGIDLNPIATLVSQAKTNKLTNKQIKIIDKTLINIKNDISNLYNKEYVKKINLPEFKNRDHWFQTNVMKELYLIKINIEEINDKKITNFLKCALSAIIVRVSNQESDTRFASINKNIQDYETIEHFEKKVFDMKNRIIEFSLKASNSKIQIYQANTMNMNFLRDNSVDHVITSPPYANTYDYYLYHKFRMYWLDFDVKNVQKREIGSRNRYSSKKEDPKTFINDIRICFEEISRVLKPNKYAVIVIGDSIIKQQLIKINKEINEICTQSHFRVIKEISYNMKANSRVFNPKFGNPNKLEHIIFLKNKK